MELLTRYLITDEKLSEWAGTFVGAGGYVVAGCCAGGPIGGLACGAQYVASRSIPAFIQKGTEFLGWTMKCAVKGIKAAADCVK